MLASGVISSVLPSGAAAFTALLATMPPAPGLFSTTTGRPSDSCILSAISRVTVSLLAPAGKPSTMCSGWSSARACMAKAAPTMSASAAADFFSMPFLPDFAERNPSRGPAACH